MERRPRSRAAKTMSPAVITTVGLVGLFLAAAINLLIVFGENQYDKTVIGSTMGLVAFSLMLAVAAYESRDRERDHSARGDLRQQDAEHHHRDRARARAPDRQRRHALGLLGTVSLSGGQWLIGAAPAVLLFVLWELGKLLARRGRRAGMQAAPAAAENPAASAA